MSRRKPPLTIRVRQALAHAGQRLASLGAALVWPIEWVVQAIGRGLFSISERLNQADSLLLALLRLVAWPFLIIWRLIRGAGGLLIPESVRRGLAAPLVKVGDVGRGAGGGLWHLAEKLNLDGLVLWMTWLTQPLWRPIAAVGGFIYAWLTTRRYPGLLWGIPALLLLAPIVAAAAWGLFWGRSAAADRYKDAVRVARENKDYAKLNLFERKLAQLGVDTQRTDYATALALAEEDKLDEAYERMQRLAPEEAASFAPAHAWILQQLLSQRLDVPADERVRLAGRHLEHLKTLGARGPDVEFLRAVWLDQAQRLEEASDLLKPLITRMPYAAIERLRIDMQLNRVEEMRLDARAVRTHMEDAKRRKLPIDAQQYRAWAVAEELLGNQETLAPVVREWHKAAPDDPGAKRGVAILEVQHFNELLLSPTSKPRDLADRLLELVEMAESPKEYHTQLMALYRERKRSPNLEAMMEVLIKSPKTPLPVVDALGTAAALEGQVDLARQLLKRVVDAQPQNAVAWNNYAWALSQDPDRNLDLALAASNNALAISPEEFRFRETRGQINRSLERWKETVDDLEFALNGMPDSAAIHTSLADAYDALGQADLAQMHRDQTNSQ